jgi:glycosyltransferase involved in cell wall biosynthesis
MIFFPSVYTFVPVLRPMKVVVGVHDVIPERFPDYVFRGRRARLFWRLKSGLALRQATRVLTVSEHARQGIQACLHVAAERIGVTSEAPAPAFRPAADDAVSAVFQQLGLTPGQRVIVYFGGITPHKNIHMLVSVFADLIQDGRFADVRLVIAGDYTRDVFYSAYPAVRAHVEAACLEAVTFTGYIDDETAASLLTGAQVCVLPSLDEGFGLPGIEAAACGTPVIATRSSALPEVLGDAALYIDPTNPVELNAALERVLLDGALRQSMGARGLERAQRLSWQSAAERALHVFEGML